MNHSSLHNDIRCRYFKSPGPKNSRGVLEIVSQRARELAIGKILVGTCSGKMAFDALEVFDPGLKIIAVTHMTGYRKPNYQDWAIYPAGFPNDDKALSLIEGRGYQGQVADNCVLLKLPE